MSKLSKLTRAALLLIFLFGLDKVLAFGRLFIISRTVSLPLQDAFNSANNLPDLLFALISGGAFSMAFIPLLRQILVEKGPTAAWDLFSRVVNLMFLLTGLAALFVAAFAEQIVRSQVGIAPGFGPEQQQLVADLMRLNLIALMIFSVSGLVMGGLQANQHFLMPALAPFFYNVGQMIGALFFAPIQPITLGALTLPTLGLGVHGLVYGAILGAAFHLIVQIPALLKYQFHWIPALDVRDTGLISALRLMLPRLLTMFGIQLMFLMRDNFASRLDQVGAVSSLTYGWMLMQVPQTILGTAIAIALLPFLADYAAQGQWQEFSETLEKALRVMLALTLPVAAIAVAVLPPIVSLVFKFDDPAGTQLLIVTSRVYFATLAGYCMQETLARAFYARKEPWVPLRGVLFRLALYLLIGTAASTTLSHIGAPVLAAAELALTFEALYLLFTLNSRSERPLHLLRPLGAGLVVAVISGVVAYTVAFFLPGPGYLTSLAGLAVGGSVALVLAWPEAKLLLKL